MAFELERRTLLRMLGLAQQAPARWPIALRHSRRTKIQSPSAGRPMFRPGIPSSATPETQPIYKMVFDQPLIQRPKLELIPNLVTKWKLAPDALSLAVEFRDDVKFHNGDPMTADDFRYTFFDRVKGRHKIDIAKSWRKVRTSKSSRRPRRR